jgi:hypothetical protein
MEAAGWRRPGRGDIAPAAARKEPAMTKDQKVIRPKLGLLELAKQLGNGTQACRVWGIAATVSAASRSCTRPCGQI